jgi:hypothetical protein
MPDEGEGTRAEGGGSRKADGKPSLAPRTSVYRGSRSVGTGPTACLGRPGGRSPSAISYTAAMLTPYVAIAPTAAMASRVRTMAVAATSFRPPGSRATP